MTLLTPKRIPQRYHRMDLSGVVPRRLRDATATEIAQLEILVDGESSPLGKWWDVAEPGGELLQIDGDCSRCDYVAGGMDGGILKITGSVGDMLAANMTEGNVIVHGDAGQFAASSLRGGQVEIHGSAGQYAAAAAPGQSRGMRGGMLIVRGDCDRWLASRMRRGTVIVLGAVAAGCAARMIAGTVVLAGEVEAPLGSGMRRGTLLLTSSRTTVEPSVLSGFTAREECELSYLPLLLNGIAPHLPPDALPAFDPRRTMRSMGDRADGGLGECIWLRPAGADPSSLPAFS